jgi:TrmH family RNA methyltransferase
VDSSQRRITSLQNPRVKAAIRLRDRRHRERERRCLIDGAREILQAARAGVTLHELFVCEALCHTPECRQVLAEMQGWPTVAWQVTPAVFEKLAFGKRAEGVLAVAETPRAALADLRLGDDPLVAVLEGVEKPGNVGAVLRSADAAGISAVIVADGGTDLFNPNCIRASLGTVFSLPVAVADAAAAIDWLLTNELTVFAAQVDAERLYTDVDWRGRRAIVLGSESRGVSPAWRDPRFTPIRLPMRGAADSLNVSATAAVLFYEALRQRGA